MSPHPLRWLPNALTLMRCVMGGLVAWMIVMIAQQEISMSYSGFEMMPDAQAAHHFASAGFRQKWGSIALITFVVAALTDWLDGYLARQWHATSRLGRLLDPIADKFAVGLPLLAVAWASGWAFPILLPVAVIVLRDVFITGLRFAGLGASAMAVSFTAKLKTFLELILVALFLAGMAMFRQTDPLVQALMSTWVFALWGVSILSAWTGFAYIIRLFSSRELPAPSAEQET